MVLEFHIQALEEEVRHSSASKHPLYYSIHFLEDAIEILKKEIIRCKRSGGDSAVEELMPTKSSSEGCSRAKDRSEIGEKKEWMSKVQLWSTFVQYNNNFDTNNEDPLLHNKSSYGGYEASSSGGNFNHKDGAFIPFLSATMKNKGVDGFSSLAVESEVEPTDSNEKRKAPQLPEPHPQPLQKKQRRCWSPELHQQFVAALQRLGGIEMATPKQIRDVMNVEGLTNDEVKSHLQVQLNNILYNFVIAFINIYDSKRTILRCWYQYYDRIFHFFVFQKYRHYIRKLPSSARN
ncbi:hypothetical protein F511_25493 [Dorcoceras hygrometricum]|uniref:HTH myb-type domain-containing protein n=1 Tax=Dorcoceras hygrometricum TaxID=472368 RepID=A0A2Z7DE13_9LAMI|nr:hypothetical protein F511_25493 [Dorcoceras hygrometricum]